MQKIYTKDQLPPEGKYVVIHLTKDNWGDSTDKDGVYFKIAKLEKGLSKEERQKIKAGILPDSDYPTLVWHGDTQRFRNGSTKRSDMISASDEDGNNKVPYCWREFGSPTHWGQEVDYWIPLPTTYE